MCSVLKNLKDTFHEYQKSNFAFPKFHLTLHYAWFIREFGSVLSASTAHGERQHKTQVKPMHRRTSRKKRTAQQEMFSLAEVRVHLRELIAKYHIFIPRERARTADPLLSTLVRPERDEYSLTGVFHQLTSLSSDGVSSDFRHIINDFGIFNGCVSY